LNWNWSGRCEPKFVNWRLAAPKTEGGRRTWALTVTIPEQQGQGDQRSVVIRSTGANPVTFPLPLTGHGQGR